MQLPHLGEEKRKNLGGVSAAEGGRGLEWRWRRREGGARERWRRRKGGDEE